MNIKKSIVVGLLSVSAFVASSALVASSAFATPLLFDVNNNGTTNTQAGWTPVNLSNINGVSFSSVGGVVLNSRDRNALNTDGAGDIANNDMWRDFIFADERNQTVQADAGIDITISGLLANSMYGVRLWAFDDVSNTPGNTGRNMTWNGTPLSIFNGPDPSSLNSQVAVFDVLSDSMGNVVLAGRISSSEDNCCNVFVNGFELTSITNVSAPSTIAIFSLALASAGFARRFRNK